MGRKKPKELTARERLQKLVDGGEGIEPIRIEMCFAHKIYNARFAGTPNSLLENEDDPYLDFPTRDSASPRIAFLVDVPKGMEKTWRHGKDEVTT